MADVFISYSRVDREFVRKLHTALAAQNRDTWVDWEDIEYAEDWWQKICAGILESDTFIFVITPDSVRSKVCFDEIEFATKNNKRIVPVLRTDVADKADQQRMHPVISKHNWLPFHETAEFDKSFVDLLRTVDTEPAHVKPHTRLLVRAREWADAGRPISLLLRGDDLGTAENWLTAGLNKQPAPTDLHAEYISASRRAESRRTRTLLGGALTAVVVSLALSALSFFLFRQSESNLTLAQSNGATSEANAATAVYNQGLSNSRSLAAQAQLDLSGNQPDRGILLALAALKNYPYTVEAENALATAVLSNSLSEVLPDTSPSIAAWSPNGQMIALTGYSLAQSQIQIWNWDLNNTTLETSFDLAPYTVSNILVWSPDSNRLIYETRDPQNTENLQLIVWSLIDQKEIEAITLPGISNPPIVTWFPNGNEVGLVYANEAMIWNLQTNQIEFRFPYTIGQFVRWSPNGQYLLVSIQACWAPKPVIVYVAATKTEVGHFPDGCSAQWSQDSAQLVINDGRDNHFYNLDGIELRSFPAENGLFTQWSLDSKRIVTRDRDKFNIWNSDISDYTIFFNERQFPLFSLSGFQFLDISPDGHFVITQSPNVKDVYIWNTISSVPERFVGELLSETGGVSWSPNGNYIAAVSGRNNIWNAETGELVHSLGSNTFPISGKWSPDGSRLLLTNRLDTNEADETNELEPWIEIWNSATGIDEARFPGCYANWSPDGHYIIVAGFENSTMWDVDKQVIVNSFPHGGCTFGSSVSWSPDGKYFLIADANQGQITIWNADDKKLVNSLPDELISFSQVMWMHDSQKIIIVGGNPSQLQIWDAFQAKPEILSQAINDVFNVEWSPNGERIAAVSSDGSVRVWNIETGKAIYTLEVSIDNVTSLAWSPDGNHIATSYFYGDKIKIWPAWQTTDDLIDYARECCVVRELTDAEREQFGLPVGDA